MVHEQELDLKNYKAGVTNKLKVLDNKVNIELILEDEIKVDVREIYE